MIAQNKRTYFLDRSLTYLFSYDLALSNDGYLGFTSGGVRLDLDGRGNGSDVTNFGARTKIPSTAYHATDDATVLDNDAVTGKIAWFSDRLFVAEQDGIGRSDARILIHTDDDALISSSYNGLVHFGPRGYRRLLAVNPDNDEGQSFEARAFIAPRFETESVKYSWLCARQCVGYGKLVIAKGHVSAASFDIYSAG